MKPLFGPLTVMTTALAVAAGPMAHAQQEAQVEAIAPILMAEDARRWDEALFRRGLEHSDPLVRKKAALAVGRLKDMRGTALLVAHLNDPDSTVQTEIMFALGVLQDTAAVGPIIARFGERPGLWRETAQEGITALAKLNDPRVAPFFSGILRRTQPLTVDSVPFVVTQAGSANATITALDPDITVTVKAGGSGTFSVGELVYQGASFDTAAVKATVYAWNPATGILSLRDFTGGFTVDTAIIGVDSGAQWTIASIDTPVVGIALGTWSGTTCTIVLANDVSSAGSSVNGAVQGQGTLCARVYDVGKLTTPATFTIEVTHF